MIVCGFDSHPEYCCTLHRLTLASHTACKAAPEGVGVQFPPDALTARSSNGSGCLVLSQTIGVRFPYGLLTWPGGGMADAQRSERCARSGVGVRLSPWSLDTGWTGVRLPARSHKPHDVGSNPTPVTSFCGWTSVRLGLISQAVGCNSRIRDLPGEYANRKSGQVESLVIVCRFNSDLAYCS